MEQVDASIGLHEGISTHGVRAVAACQNECTRKDVATRGLTNRVTSQHKKDLTVDINASTVGAAIIRWPAYLSACALEAPAPNAYVARVETVGQIKRSDSESLSMVTNWRVQRTTFRRQTAILPTLNTSLPPPASFHASPPRRFAHRQAPRYDPRPVR